jgi:hypothetical protein
LNWGVAYADNIVILFRSKSYLKVKKCNFLMENL